jgi:6,7-dimethyl-8-ribityllumazine synthase
MSQKAIQIGIITGDFHKELAEHMIEVATAEAVRLGAEIAAVVRVPGSYEVPLLADALLGRGGFDALVVLGCIERGSTLHGEVMGHTVHAALVQLQLQYKRPIGIGIIGPGATVEQAEERKTDYAAAAVRATMRSLEALGDRRAAKV